MNNQIEIEGRVHPVCPDCKKEDRFGFELEAAKDGSYFCRVHKRRFIVKPFILSAVEIDYESR
jgi:hypothetical protein